MQIIHPTTLTLIIRPPKKINYIYLVSTQQTLDTILPAHKDFADKDPPIKIAQLYSTGMKLISPK